MTRITQGVHAASLIGATRALDARALTIEATTDVTTLAWHPGAGSWSIGQVFEHLCVANDSYLTTLRNLLATPPDGGPSRSTNPWKPSLAGRFLVASFESTRKQPAPKIWRPAPEPRANVIGEFLEREREIVALIERSMAFDWTRLRLASPVSSLIRMNVGDAFTILVRHAERHFRQIDRIRAAYESRAASREAAFTR